MAKEQISSILRALRILECFMDGETEWTLKALVEHLGLPTTTVFRQVSTLAERQYLEQDPVRKSYRPGPRLLLLSSAILGQSDLRRTARPELERLSDTLKETINLSVLLERDIFYLDKVETHRSIVCNTQVGSRAPAYATSAGKAMLACQDDDQIEAYCRWMEEAAYPLTGKTITSPERLREELAAARLRGYAIDDGEIEDGLLCVAAPICDMNHRPVGAVSVSGPDYRMQADQAVMIREVCRTAQNISRLLGYRGTLRRETI
ncbi:IclR family transcriptional regulator [uncultured Oscillibacter sp.]|uniref:IclR family transcriptional regulator n=1 Tax=uncultured Oscillibacter sp. TaxID=876091 RepID=UPI0025E1B3F8|nr:IclR family transcriptional regulator [uncultured Oscillibacter sp.]